MSTTGERIRAARRAKGMTQSELADKVGVQYSAIHKYETGLIVNLKRDTIAKLAEALDVKPSYLMCLDDDITKQISEESASGRTNAKEELYRLFGIEHSAADLRLLGDKAAILYYKALDRRAAPELLDIITALDSMSLGELGSVRQTIRAYLRADTAIKEIVDTALKPYKQDESLGEEIG